MQERNFGRFSVRAPSAPRAPFARSPITVLVVLDGSGRARMLVGALIISRLALLPAVRVPYAHGSRCDGVACSDALSEDAIASKLQRLQRQRPGGARRPASAGACDVAADRLPGRSVGIGSESANVPVWEVPDRLRMPGAVRAEAHGRHHSLEDTFPGTGLAEAWDKTPALRTALRRALRADLFAPFMPADWDARRRACASGLGAACMVSWRSAERECECDTFSAAFAEHGVRLSGSEFVLGMGHLCGADAAGSLIDIIPLGRRIVHSWHQVHSPASLPRLSLPVATPLRAVPFASCAALTGLWPARPRHGAARLPALRRIRWRRSLLLLRQALAPAPPDARDRTWGRPRVRAVRSDPSPLPAPSPALAAACPVATPAPSSCTPPFSPSQVRPTRAAAVRVVCTAAALLEGQGDLGLRRHDAPALDARPAEPREPVALHVTVSPRFVLCSCGGMGWRWRGWRRSGPGQGARRRRRSAACSAV